MIYFTSDTHFYHTNIISYCDRPFKNVEEMNDFIITNWNNTIKPNDTVYMLGDMFFHTRQVTPDIMKDILTSLNGNKILIQGNHDRHLQVYKQLNIPIYQEVVMIIAKRKCILSHYPYKPYGMSLFKRFKDWIRRFKVKHFDKRPLNQGHVLICGHTHSKEQVKDKMIHIGVDAWKFMPVSMTQVEAIVNRLS